MIIEQPHTWIRRLTYPEAIWRMDKDDKSVYLSFDDGPIPEVTPWVLDVLDKYNIKATFFCVVENVYKHPDIFQKLLDKGHKVGNHTYHHLKGAKCDNDVFFEDIEKANALIKSEYFRPPHGLIKRSQMKTLINKHHYKIVLWDVITRDYNYNRQPEKIMKAIKERCRNGSIIVFHDSIKASKNLYACLEPTITFLIENGYKFKTL